MAKYQWDIKKIRKLKQECLTNPEIFNNKALFNSYQDFCHRLMVFYRVDKYSNLEPIEPEDLDEIDLEYSDIETLNINTEALNIISELNPTIEYMVEKENRYLNEKIFLNNDELIDLVRELVNLIHSKQLNDSFEEYFNPKNNFININYLKFSIGIHGITTTDFINKVCYAAIFRENSLNDIITTFHEFFHMHLRKYDNYDFFNTSKVIYGEVEGCFANFLINSLSNQLDIDKDLFLFSVYDEFNYILETLKTLNFFDLKNNFSNTDIQEMTTDSISYLTALDLFYLYQKDPEKSLYRLSNIPNLTGENIKKELIKNDVTFFEDNCKNFKKLYKSL